MAKSKTALRKHAEPFAKVALILLDGTVPDCASLFALQEATAQLIAIYCPIAKPNTLESTRRGKK